MPFLAERQGKFVLPPQADDDDPLTCPKCGDSMGIKDGEIVARHFYHRSNSECSGESPEHLRMKSIAYSNLTGAFPDAEIELSFDEEAEIHQAAYPDAEVELEREIGDRRADVRVVFDTPRFPDGKGIGVEVQHRHEDKDIHAVTVEYLQDGFSVLWLDSDDFDGYDVDLSGVLSVWPHGIFHDFSEGYHEAVQALQTQSQPSVERRIFFPRGLLNQHREDLRKSWKRGRFLSGDADDDLDLCYEHLSGEVNAQDKWIRVSMAPRGDTVLQLGKSGSGTFQQVSAPIQLNNRGNRGKVHSLAYAVAECDPEGGSGWTDLEKVWLDSGIYNVSVLLKLVSSSKGRLCLSLGRYGDEDEFVTVAPDSSGDLRRALHTVAEELD